VHLAPTLTRHPEFVASIDYTKSIPQAAHMVMATVAITIILAYGKRSSSSTYKRAWRQEGAPVITRRSITKLRRCAPGCIRRPHSAGCRLCEQLTAASSTAVTMARFEYLPMTDDSYQSDCSASRSTDVASITAMTAFESVYWPELAQWAVACRANVTGGGSPGM
jgi:hypothetical protein